MSRSSGPSFTRSPLSLALRRASIPAKSVRFKSSRIPFHNEFALRLSKLPPSVANRKRPADAAGFASFPKRLPPYANLPNHANIGIGSMQDRQSRDDRRQPWPTISQAWTPNQGRPSTSSQPRGQQMSPANASAFSSSGFAYPPAYPYTSIERDNVDTTPSHPSHIPSFASHSALPPSPFPTSFGIFNSPTSQQIPMPNSGNFPQTQAMPYVNPNFSSQYLGSMPSFPLPGLPLSATLPFQNTQPMSTLARHHGMLSPKPRSKRSGTPPVKIPKPSNGYMKQASQEPQRRSRSQPLLVILDLNGTLIFRKTKKLPPSFVRRAGLDDFLEELTNRYAVMVWSSSRPATVEAVCQQLFPGDKKSKVVAMWARDKFDLTTAQYNSKLQVYKELSKVWADPTVQASHPNAPPASQRPVQMAKASAGRRGGKFSKKNQNLRQKAEVISLPVGQRWDQTNTILIDDSKLKALSEPYNILEIPEFTNDKSIDESMLFAGVLQQLDELSHYDDVSKVLRLESERAGKTDPHVLLSSLPVATTLPKKAKKDKDNTRTPATPVAADGAQTALNHAKDLAEQKKQVKKARKRAKKEAKKAAKAAQQPPTGQAPPKNQTPNQAVNGSSIIPNTTNTDGEAPPDNNTNGAPKPTRNQRRQAAREARRAKKARLLEEGRQAAVAAVAAELPQQPVETDTGVRSNVRDREPDDSDIVDSHQRARSPSSASCSSSVSSNSLLDRLEHGLGMERVKSDE